MTARSPLRRRVPLRVLAFVSLTLCTSATMGRSSRARHLSEDGVSSHPWPRERMNALSGRVYVRLQKGDGEKHLSVAYGTRPGAAYHAEEPGRRPVMFPGRSVDTSSVCRVVCALVKTQVLQVYYFILHFEKRSATRHIFLVPSTLPGWIPDTWNRGWSLHFILCINSRLSLRQPTAVCSV